MTWLVRPDLSAMPGVLFDIITETEAGKVWGHPLVSRFDRVTAQAIVDAHRHSLMAGDAEPWHFECTDRYRARLFCGGAYVSGPMHYQTAGKIVWEHNRAFAT